MARFTLPSLLAGLSERIGGVTATRNARTELDLAEQRDADADDLIRRVEAHSPMARQILAADTDLPSCSSAQHSGEPPRTVAA